MSLSHFFSITQTWRIAISWLDTPGRILSSTWYHRWLQLVTPMRQNAQKRSRKFCRSKEDKNGETHPIQPEKGETGCVLGAGGDGNGWEQVRTDGKARKARGKLWDGLVSPAASGAAPRWGAPSTDRGGSRDRRLDAAHRAAGPHDTHRRRACGRTSLPNPTAH